MLILLGKLVSLIVLWVKISEIIIWFEFTCLSNRFTSVALNLYDYSFISSNANFVKKISEINSFIHEMHYIFIWFNFIYISNR
jgi:hypothetical protein